MEKELIEKELNELEGRVSELRYQLNLIRHKEYIDKCAPFIGKWVYVKGEFEGYSTPFFKLESIERYGLEGTEIIVIITQRGTFNVETEKSSRPLAFFENCTIADDAFVRRYINRKIKKFI